jgi:hypothetical protein
MSDADFHRALAALGAPEGVTELAETLLAALRAGHNLEQDRIVGNPSLRLWVCSRCAMAVVWQPGDDRWHDAAARVRCVDALRGDLAQGFELDPQALAWLAEHDRTEAGRG